MISVDRGPVAVVRLEHGKANALDLELLEALDETFGSLEAEDGPQAVVLTGTGSIFSAGVDLFRLVDGGADYVDRFLPALSTVLRRVFSFPLPLVAAVNGHAIAGGCLLACACDYRIMARGRGTLGVPELRVGVPFPLVAIEILRFATSTAHLQELVYRGATYSPDEAWERGLVDETVEAEELGERAREVARGLGAEPSDRFRITKQQLRRPTVERIERLAPLTEGSVTEAWKSPATHAAIREYLDSLRR